uniref:Uncharacterized protein n=1 Tax=Rangifer tarandus platyrhynchus TaxID=3082113 RepID=A0ACB0EDQ5_RANTA|nr:unnamed protein product [Rangifer tarandus platyrhynchus]
MPGAEEESAGAGGQPWAGGWWSRRPPRQGRTLHAVDRRAGPLLHASVLVVARLFFRWEATARWALSPLWLAVILPKRIAKCRELAWAGSAWRLQLCAFDVRDAFAPVGRQQPCWPLPGHQPDFRAVTSRGRSDSTQGPLSRPPAALPGCWTPGKLVRSGGCSRRRGPPDPARPLLRCPGQWPGDGRPPGSAGAKWRGPHPREASMEGAAAAQRWKRRALTLRRMLFSHTEAME